MRSEQFAYWLQGFFEVSGQTAITPEQTEIIKKHLNLVFVHELDPQHGNQAHQDKLNAIHNPQETIVKPDTFFRPEKTQMRC